MHKAALLQELCFRCNFSCATLYSPGLWICGTDQAVRMYGCPELKRFIKALSCAIIHHRSVDCIGDGCCPGHHLCSLSFAQAIHHVKLMQLLCLSSSLCRHNFASNSLVVENAMSLLVRFACAWKPGVFLWSVVHWCTTKYVT
jgi:hypothetical protein